MHAAHLKLRPWHRRAEHGGHHPEVGEGLPRLPCRRSSRQTLGVIRASAVAEYGGQLFRQAERVPQPGVQGGGDKRQPMPWGRAYTDDGERTDVPHRGRGTEARTDTVPQRRRGEGVPLLVPDGAAPQRHREADVGRGTPSGRIHEAGVPPAQDGRTRVPRHNTTGGGSSGRGGKPRRSSVRRQSQHLLRQQHAGVVVRECRHRQAHHVPLRPSHVRRDDARHRHGHLHGEQAARTP